MFSFLTFDQIPGFTVDDSWRIEDAEAMALLAAPCLAGALTTDQVSQVRAVLRQALTRWKEAGAGATTTTTAGPFAQTIDTHVSRKGMFWPSELEQLRRICGGGSAKSGTSSTLASDLSIHTQTCSLALGALYCSCGADIAGFPLFEGAAE